jgi:hypothetical protein
MFYLFPPLFFSFVIFAFAAMTKEKEEREVVKEKFAIKNPLKQLSKWVFLVNLVLLKTILQNLLKLYQQRI